LLLKEKIFPIKNTLKVLQLSENQKYFWYNCKV